MKTKYLFAALLVVLGLVATGCQKETPSTPVDTTVHTIAYTVDGEEHQQTLQGQEALENFVTWVMQLTRQGHTVVATDLEAATSQHASKETVVFVTTDEREAAAWEVSMLLQGYTVTTVYDSTTGEYHCSATITSTGPLYQLVGTSWYAYSDGGRYLSKSNDTIFFLTDSTGIWKEEIIAAGGHYYHPPILNEYPFTYTNNSENRQGFISFFPDFPLTIIGFVFTIDTTYTINYQYNNRTMRLGNTMGNTGVFSLITEN